MSKDINNTNSSACIFECKEVVHMEACFKKIHYKSLTKFLKLVKMYSH